ncbi:PhoD-like phosphatase N-terminal domain-containing protein, partial [Methylobacterium brachiatum]
SAVVWARSDRPARAIIEWATTESFSEIRGGVFADALPGSDGTVKVALTGLPPGQDVFYRVRLQDVAAPTTVGPAQVGRYRTAPADKRSVSFCWSGDTVGQGWG